MRREAKWKREKNTGNENQRGLFMRELLSQTESPGSMPVLGGYIDEIIGYRPKHHSAHQRSPECRLANRNGLSNSRVEYAIGGHAAEVIYTYAHEGEYYGGTHRRPFFFGSSAKDYLERFEPDFNIGVRVKPGQPEISFVPDDDQT